VQPTGNVVSSYDDDGVAAAARGNALGSASRPQPRAPFRLAVLIGVKAFTDSCRLIGDGAVDVSTFDDPPGPVPRGRHACDWQWIAARYPPPDPGAIAAAPFGHGLSRSVAFNRKWHAAQFSFHWLSSRLNDEGYREKERVSLLRTMTDSQEFGQRSSGAATMKATRRRRQR
jgi:hypothetical protein